MRDSAFRLPEGLRDPKQPAAHLCLTRARPLTDELDLPVVFHVVEGDGYPRGLPVQHSKLTPIGLPGKGYDGFCHQKRGSPLWSWKERA